MWMLITHLFVLKQFLKSNQMTDQPYYPLEVLDIEQKGIHMERQEPSLFVSK